MLSSKIYQNTYNLLIGLNLYFGNSKFHSDKQINTLTKNKKQKILMGGSIISISTYYNANSWYHFRSQVRSWLNNFFKLNNMYNIPFNLCKLVNLFMVTFVIDFNFIYITYQQIVFTEVLLQTSCKKHSRPTNLMRCDQSLQIFSENRRELIRFQSGANSSKLPLWS